MNIDRAILIQKSGLKTRMQLWWSKLKVKAALGHLGLLLTLMVYTTAGGIVFRALEHPAEVVRVSTLNDSLFRHRRHLMATVINSQGREVANLSALVSAALGLYERALQDVVNAGVQVTSLEPPAAMWTPESEDHQDMELSTGIVLAREAGDEDWSLVKAVFFSSTVLTTIVAPLEFMLSESEGRIPLANNNWSPYDPQEYLIVYLYLYMSTIITDYLPICADPFYVCLIIFGIGQFKMIQQAIKDFNPKGDDSYEEIKDIIQHHNRIFEYYNDVEDFIKPLSNLVFLITSLLFCAVAIKILAAEASVNVTMEIIYLAMVVVQLFYYFWYANEVIFESQNVGGAVSESNWYKFSPRVRKALFLLMMRSKKPTSLSTGVIYTISIETFVMMVKTAYTFLTIFRNVIQRD